MFAKRLLHKALHHQGAEARGGGEAAAAADQAPQMDAQVALHYGVPYTASLLAFDPIQRLLAVATLDGRIKIFGGDNIQGLLISPNSVPYKFLQFIQNQGLLIAISNENEIQVWNLEFRQLFSSSQWDVNITAFAVIEGTFLMYLGDENGLLSVFKYDVDDGNLRKMPYNIPIQSIAETDGISLLDPQPIVGILPQPGTFGTRVLIAFEKGLLVLWDVSEDRAICVRGYGDLQMKGQVAGAQRVAGEDQSDNTAEESEEEREICSLCWASKGGSIVAVGYITGDILLWDMTTRSSRQDRQGDVSSNVVKLQLASGNRRLPVIILHWSTGSAGDTKGGHLFVYGGDDMGSEEVLTVLSLESAAGLESVRCMSRMDLKLDGSFADMILIPDTGVLDQNRTAALFILTNPGQLNFYDGGSLFSTRNTKEDNAVPEAQKFPVTVPTIDPNITVTNLCSLTGRNFPNISLKKFCEKQNTPPFIPGNMKWPLTGGVPSEMSLNEDHDVERIYIAGYQDGSVRIWDATFPVLMPMFILDGKVPEVNMDGENAVSSLAFCPLNMTLAVGTTSGLVRIYKLREHAGGSSFHFVSESKQEVHVIQHGRGFHCNIAFMASNSPVRSLVYSAAGEVLAAGYQNGQVAMFDTSQLSIMFSGDCASGKNSPVVSLSVSNVSASAADDDQSKKDTPQTENLPRDVFLSLTKDARVTLLDSTAGVMKNSHLLDHKQTSAVSMYVIDGASHQKQTQTSENKSPRQCQTGKECNDLDKKQAQGVDKQSKSASQLSHNGDSDSLLLVCFEDVLILYSVASLSQGSSKHLQKMKLTKPCSWTAFFKDMDGRTCGLILVYQTGTIELRSVPDLAIVAEYSLMSLLRWSYKTGMDKSTSASNGQIALVNGSEFAIISVIASENDFRIPESLPCLHDKVLAAAAEAAISFSIDQRRKNPAAGILDGIIKGIKGKAEGRAEMKGIFSVQTPSELLESIFMEGSSVQPSQSNPDDLIEELSIDDIDIDDEVSLAPATSSMSHVNKKTTVEEERAKLFKGSSDSEKPRMRTPQEILTKYKFGGDAAAAAAHAKDKLMQRQEKLERISQQTAELQNGAENFASLAQELAKTMESKKWWKL